VEADGAAVSESRVGVLLVDDHPMVRAGLTGLIDATDDLRVVGEASDGEAAVASVRELAPRVVLMDISMPGVDGIAATRRLFEEGYAGAVVVLTSFSDRERVVEALAAGAVGYLLKDSEPADVLAAIRAAAEGHAPLDPRVAGALLPTRRDAPGPISALASARCCCWSRTGWPTSRSRNGSASPSGP
jgi:DNA-binding NarL/FixJ family response regulator